MNQDTMRDHWERVAKTTRAQWDASPYTPPSAVRPRQGVLVIKPKAYDTTQHREQGHA